MIRQIADWAGSKSACSAGMTEISKTKRLPLKNTFTNFLSADGVELPAVCCY